MILSPAENRRAFSHDRPAAPRTGQVRPRAARADAFAIRLCLLVLIAWCGATLLAVPFARARSAPLTIVQGKGRLVSLEGPASNVFAADPKVVAVRPADSNSLFVFGLAPGETSIVATNRKGREVADFTVTVLPGHYAADRFEGGQRHVDRRAKAPPHAVPVTNGVTLRGETRTPQHAADLANLARENMAKGQTLNERLNITGPVQVTLKVRVASMSRGVTRQLGINWQSIGKGVQIGKFVFGFQTLGNLLGAAAATGAQPPGAYSLSFPPDTVPIDGILNALSTDNLARILAEPTLTALSGQTADFIDGGSFPVPVPGPNGEVGVQFQNYGVQLGFTPTVLDDGRIILRVNPTVSAVTSQNQITLNVGSSTYVVPSLIQQAASTTVVLGSGQTLAIAGLFQDTSNQTDNSVPGLGDIPVIGGVFRNNTYKRTQSELVILVTPYLVRPVSDPSKLRVPGQDWTPPNDIQRMLFSRDSGSPAAGRPIPGNAGFLLD